MNQTDRLIGKTEYYLMPADYATGAYCFYIRFLKVKMICNNFCCSRNFRFCFEMLFENFNVACRCNLF